MMKTLVGIFPAPGFSAAAAALQDLRENNFSQDQFILLTSDTLSTKSLSEATPTPEPPGACGANTGQVSGAITGFASGILGGALVSLLVPGIGPILAVGALAFGGSLGAVAGGVVGNAVQVNLEPTFLPEEQFIYEEALRQGAQVLVIQPTSSADEEVARNILATHGAENATQARERWWHQLRTNEENTYPQEAEPFSIVETRYRQGFEAALNARLRGKTREEKDAFLVHHHATMASDDAFRRGFARGEHYYEAILTRGDPRRSTAFAAIDEGASAEQST
jgi:hypothetical protein